MVKTHLRYLADSYLFSLEAKVLEVGKNEQGRDFVILDQTIFYPQGGGQPYDTGKISGVSTTFSVTEVKLAGEDVYHYGVFDQKPFSVGETVNLAIDQPRRRLNCRLHSAGHLLDIVFRELGGNLEPIKGFHFPEGPYVEYLGQLPDGNESFTGKLEAKINEYINQGFEVSTEILLNRKELAKRCSFVPDYIPDNKPIRVVTLLEDKATPCGGTHVKDIKEIGQVKIVKIKNKDGNTRISYQVMS